MNDLDDNKLPRQRLTVERMTGLLRVQSGVVLFLTAIGISQLFVRHFLLAAAALVAAVALALIVFSLWKQHRMVKAGTAVYAVLPRSEFQMPQIVSIGVVLVLTGFVGLCSAFVVSITIANFNTQVGWTVSGVTLLAIWLFIAYCWYRIFTDKPQARPVLVQEQPEGVWPPAPFIPENYDNKD